MSQMNSTSYLTPIDAFKRSQSGRRSILTYHPNTTSTANKEHIVEGTMKRSQSNTKLLRSLSGKGKLKKMTSTTKFTITKAGKILRKLSKNSFRSKSRKLLRKGEEELGDVVIWEETFEDKQ